MPKSARLTLSVVLLLALAGCATAPPSLAPDYPAAPPRKCVDAKTQLETGRRC